VLRLSKFAADSASFPLTRIVDGFGDLRKYGDFGPGLFERRDEFFQTKIAHGEICCRRWKADGLLWRIPELIARAHRVNFLICEANNFVFPLTIAQGLAWSFLRIESHDGSAPASRIGRMRGAAWQQWSVGGSFSRLNRQRQAFTFGSFNYGSLSGLA